MNPKTIRYFIIGFAYLAVAYPLWVRFRSLTWVFDFDLLLSNLFPMFGLAAFAILWLHVVSGVFEPWLRENFDFDRFVNNTSFLLFIFIILHPLLLLISLNFSFSNLFLAYGVRSVWLGIIAWLLLITYDIGKAFKKRGFFSSNWNNILIISTVGIILIFFHSLDLGSDLQSGHLRVIWLFYGLTAIIAAIYVYGIKRFLISSHKI